MPKWKPPLKTHMMSEILADIDNADHPMVKHSKLVQEIPEPKYWQTTSDDKEAPEDARTKCDAAVQADADEDVVLPATRVIRLDAEVQADEPPPPEPEKEPVVTVLAGKKEHQLLNHGPFEKDKRREKSRGSKSKKRSSSDRDREGSGSEKRSHIPRDDYERLRMERKLAEKRGLHKIKVCVYFKTFFLNF